MCFFLTKYIETTVAQSALNQVINSGHVGLLYVWGDAYLRIQNRLITFKMHMLIL